VYGRFFHAGRTILRVNENRSLEMRSVLRALTVLVLTLLLMGSAWSQATPSAKPANAEPSSDAATLVMFNRPVVVFRSSLLGAPPKARVDRARFFDQ
jgi:hypothetical protein